MDDGRQAISQAWAWSCHAASQLFDAFGGIVQGGHGQSGKQEGQSVSTLPGPEFEHVVHVLALEQVEGVTRRMAWVVAVHRGVGLVGVGQCWR